MTRPSLSECGSIRSAITLSSVIVALAAAGCEMRVPASNSALPSKSGPSLPELMPLEGPQVRDTPPGDLAERLTKIDDAVLRWRGAPNVRVARAAAEEARNLVVGPAGPYYGDADGDGEIAGATDAGLLPGLAGEAALAQTSDNACVIRDVLGGDWSEPARRWAVLKTAIDGWRSSRNTFPSLPSHPQRIVGWATLTLSAENLATAREYGGHAQIHVVYSRNALVDCKQ